MGTQTHTHTHTHACTHTHTHTRTHTHTPTHSPQKTHTSHKHTNAPHECNRADMCTGKLMFAHVSLWSPRLPARHPPITMGAGSLAGSLPLPVLTAPPLTAPRTLGAVLPPLRPPPTALPPYPFWANERMNGPETSNCLGLGARRCSLGMISGLGDRRNGLGGHHISLRASRRCRNHLRASRRRRQARCERHVATR
jgi:hypothetical protein